MDYDSPVNDPVEIDRFTTFSGASKCSRRLAGAYKEPVLVRPSGNGWAVLAHSRVANSRISFTEEDGDFDDSEWQLEQEQSSEHDFERSEIMAEILEDQEQWAGSDEEGWYYPDQTPT